MSVPVIKLLYFIIIACASTYTVHGIQTTILLPLQQRNLFKIYLQYSAVSHCGL